MTTFDGDGDGDGDDDDDGDDGDRDDDDDDGDDDGDRDDYGDVDWITHASHYSLDEIINGTVPGGSHDFGRWRHGVD